MTKEGGPIRIGEAMESVGFLSGFKKSGKFCPIHEDSELYIYDGKLLGCGACHSEKERREKKEAEINEKLARYAIPDLEGIEWKTIDEYDQRQINIRNKLMDYARGKERWRNLVLIGRQGTGKSLFAYLLAKDLIRRNHYVKRVKSRDFSNELERLRMSKFESTESYLRDLQKADVLIFEEVGRSVQSKTEFDILFSLMDYYIEQKKKIVFTSNLPFSPDGERVNGVNYFVDFVDEDRVMDESRWELIPFGWDSYRRNHAKK